jgi:hypothetical protein
MILNDQLLDHKPVTMHEIRVRPIPLLIERWAQHNF